MKLTPKIFEKDKNWIKLKDDIRPGTIAFESNTKFIRRFFSSWNLYVTVTFGVDNLTGGNGVTFHIDNCDMDTIASFDVETVEQANQILGVYGIHIGFGCDGCGCEFGFDPTWAGDTIIAEFALPIIKSLTRKTNTYPPTITWKKWRRILSSIIFSLYQIQNDRDLDAHKWYVKMFGVNKNGTIPGWDAYCDRVQQGLQDFGKYFRYLNW